MIRELKWPPEESKRKVSTQPEPNLVISPDWPTKVNGDRDEDVNDDADNDAVADDGADARFSGCCPSQQQRRGISGQVQFLFTNCDPAAARSQLVNITPDQNLI